jgi:hypothetical protein
MTTKPSVLSAVKILAIDAQLWRAGAYASCSGADWDPTKPDPWLAGYDAATANRLKGLDPFGKPPGIPKLCAKDVRKVCNCADSSRRECLLEQYPAPPVGPLARVRNRIRDARKTLKDWLSSPSGSEWED